MTTTLNWLVNESDLKELKVVSCPELLNTAITGVNILDNPDSFQWIKQGELLLTTGYIFQDDPELQLHLLSDLKKAGCAALCLKTQRFLNTFPKEMIQKANELGLVCIELPYFYSLAQISDEVSRHIYNEQFEQAVNEQAFFNNLFNAFFQGKSLNEILQIVSDYLLCSVFVIDNQQQIPWYAFLPEDIELSPDNEILVPEYVRIQKPEKNNLYTTGIIRILGKTSHICLMPLSNPRYQLCFWHKSPKQLSWNTISQILRIIDFSRTNNRIQHTSVSNYYDSFFHYLLEPNTFNEASAIQLFEYYGIPYAPQAICIVLTSKNKKKKLPIESILTTLKKAISTNHKHTSQSFIAYNTNQICLCLFEYAPDILQKIPAFVETCQKTQCSDLIAGISRNTLIDLSMAYQEAVFMLSLARIFPTESIFSFRDYMLFWTIFKMPEDEKKSLYESMIMPLVEYDKHNHANLTETLQMYFACHLNSSLAATKLYIHRNTFLKRMEKIQSLIDLDLNNHNNLFSIYYCLCIYQTLSEF